ncbi:MAG: polysaccharide deacetylase family protein [Clostridiales bacterium]|nr:polysaccharide deacetylase family protein [Clostridiales bacterium]
MYVLTMTRRRLLRVVLCTTLIIAGISIGIYAVLSAVNTGASAKKVPIYSVNRDDKKISITFDAAWGNSDTDELIEILREGGVKATFFVTGEWVDKFPEDIKKFFDEGHEIQNHSDKHPHPRKIGINELIEDTRNCGIKIEEVTGVAPTLYRAPYGEYNDKVVTTVEGMGYKFIQWNVDSIDWKDLEKDKMINRIVSRTKNGGDILLFHNDRPNTMAALPEIINKLKENGFEFVTVSDLIYQSDYRIDNRGIQYSNMADSSPGDATPPPETDVDANKDNADDETLSDDALNEDVKDDAGGEAGDDALNDDVNDDEEKPTQGKPKAIDKDIDFPTG